MTDLRLKYGEDYYKELRKKRKTKPTGRIQNLSDDEKKALSKKALQSRWGKKEK